MKATLAAALKVERNEQRQMTPIEGGAAWIELGDARSIYVDHTDVVVEMPEGITWRFTMIDTTAAVDGARTLAALGNR